MPGKKNKVVAVRLPDDTYEAAKQKAESRGSTLAKVIQAFAHLFANDETPPGWPPDLPEATSRAAETHPRNIKRDKKKKKT